MVPGRYRMVAKLWGSARIVEVRLVDGVAAFGKPGGNEWSEVSWWERLLYRFDRLG